MFVLALVFSMLIHLTAGAIWSGFGHRIASAIARYHPRPKATPDELVALSDAITITKRTVPPPNHAALLQRHQIAAAPVRPVPTAIPTVTPTVVPTIQPTPEPKTREHARIHHPRPVPTVAALSPQQIAALNEQSRRTIAEAQTNVAQLKEPPSTAQRRYQLVMAGAQHDLQEAQGLCYGTAPPVITGIFIEYYVACEIQYPDGYSEYAVIPWPMRFPRDNDPIAEHRPYHATKPPDGFSLPPDFELSRFVCSYFRAQCAAEISRRVASGTSPS